jgi:hypothetical protein
MKEFNEDGLTFSYPDDWQLTREASPEGWTVTLQSPGTAFAVVRLDRSMPPTEEVAAQALEALQEEYPKLDARANFQMIGGELAVGHDVEFFTLDLATTCLTRSFYAGAGTVFVMRQVCDVDEEQYQPALTALCDSMQFERD